MQDEQVKRNYYWSVEAVTNNGKVLYNGTFNNFQSAWDKYYSFKHIEDRATVSLQRRYKEFKVA